MQKNLIRYCTSTLCLLVTLSGCGKSRKSPETIPATTTTLSKSKSGKKMQTLLSGLRYEVIQEAPANASSAKRGNQVTVHYTGWLNAGGDQKGSMFDSSVKRGQKFTFLLGAAQVIQGWDQGIQNMKVGEKRMLYIPARLAYGDRAMGNQIPANSDLIFEVELFDIK